MLSRFRRLPKSGQVRHGHSRRFCCCRFINLANNSSKLDKMAFAPFARVIDGMATTVDKFYAGNGDIPQANGEGPDPNQIREDLPRSPVHEIGRIHHRSVAVASRTLAKRLFGAGGHLFGFPFLTVGMEILGIALKH